MEKTDPNRVVPIQMKNLYYLLNYMKFFLEARISNNEAALTFFAKKMARCLEITLNIRSEERSKFFDHLSKVDKAVQDQYATLMESMRVNEDGSRNPDGDFVDMDLSNEIWTQNLEEVCDDEASEN